MRTPTANLARHTALVIAASAALASLYEVIERAVGIGTGWASLFMAIAAGVVAAALLRRFRRLDEAARQAEQRLYQSERRARALLEHSSDLIAILNPDGTVRLASPSHRRVLGYDPAELVGTNAFDIVHPDDRPGLIEAFGQQIRSGAAPISREFRIRHRDGSWRVVESVAQAALDDPVIRGAVINSRDISARRRAESEKAAVLVEYYAAQSEEAAVTAALARFGRALLSELNRPALLDRLCRLTTEEFSCEMSHTYLFDKEREDYEAVAGSGNSTEEWEAIRVVRIPRAFLDLYGPALADTDVLDVDMRGVGITRDPLSRPHERPRLLAMALRRNGEIVGVHVARYRNRPQPCSPVQERIARGLARLASLALENARLVDELDRASRVKADFVASMSHELRTPLNVIIGYSDLLIDHIFGELAVEQRETVRRIGDQGRELLELVNTTLDMSRLESGRVPLALQEVDLVHLLAEIEVEAQLVRRNAALSLTWQVAPDIPPLWTDPVKLKVVIKNLMLNALKFTDEGGVVVHAVARGDGVEIAVTDTGIGIAPELLAKVFEPFRQGDHGGVRRGGVGLGLHIVRRLLDMLGGTIAVESEPTRGSTFRMWVPSRRQVEPPRERPMIAATATAPVDR